MSLALLDVLNLWRRVRRVARYRRYPSAHLPSACNYGRVRTNEVEMRRRAHLLCTEVVCYLRRDGDASLAEVNRSWRRSEKGKVVVHRRQGKTTVGQQSDS